MDYNITAQETDWMIISSQPTGPKYRGGIIGPGTGEYIPLCYSYYYGTVLRLLVLGG
jgi:hypothetical protein